MRERVGFAGDWHGNFPWAMACLRAAAREGLTTIYHVGDFGIWPGKQGAYYLHKLNERCEELGIALYIVPGNHEDYDQIDAMTTGDDGWLLQRRKPRLRYAPRGHTWTSANGTTMAAMGGTTSIDKLLRSKGTSWWPQEVITEQDVERLVANVFERTWHRVDVMLTHDAPAGLKRPSGPGPAWFTEEIRHEAWQQRVLLRDAVDAVAPRWLVHGHWHAVYRDQLDGVSGTGWDYRCDVLGLAMDEMYGNLWAANLVPDEGLEDVERIHLT